MENTPTYYIDVVLPLARDFFTYSIRQTLAECISEGMCVAVELGRNKIYTGIVWKIYESPPAYNKIKQIAGVVEKGPVITRQQMRFWEWIAEYYMCTLGEVMRVALPSALKPDGFSIAEYESRVYAERPVLGIKLGPKVESLAILDEIFESLEKKAPRQYNLLLEFCRLAEGKDVFSVTIPRNLLRCDSTVLNSLCKKGILKTLVMKEESLDDISWLLPKLSIPQEKATTQVHAYFNDKKPVLLHGVTGSGKTEIYITLIAEYLSRGENVLYLLPEIAMTGQLVDRLQAYFGKRVVKYHSSFSEKIRAATYLKVNRGDNAFLVIGTRSSLFLPAKGLGLVVVDEEHDGSYKNSETNPRYHGRDCALMLGTVFGADVLLGSATPSLESYSNAISGKYGLVELHERYGDAQMPRIFISDTIRSVKRGERTSHFNKELLDGITLSLSSGSQVMLFQNRRGFAPYIECDDCGWSARCPQCNVTLTLHKRENRLKCHYCGYISNINRECPSCKSMNVNPKGFGTEKVEEELLRLFPEAVIDRLDRDTASSPSRYNSVIGSFAKGDTDILVGTQMITKGFDFDGVSMVGILNADNLLSYPDFRAAERAFQVMTQVSGRAGRRDRVGNVIIQTSQPENPVVRFVVNDNYKAMAGKELAERKTFFYPPYCRLISVTFKHKDFRKLNQAANEMAKKAGKIFGKRLSGPVPPPVDRIRGEYMLNFLLKIERNHSFSKAKKLLRDCISDITANKEYTGVAVICDVDPQ